MCFADMQICRIAGMQIYYRYVAIVELAVNVTGVSGDHVKAKATVSSWQGFSWTGTDPRVRT